MPVITLPRAHWSCYVLTSLVLACADDRQPMMPAPPVAVILLPDSIALSRGDSSRLNVRVLSLDGHEIEAPVQWTSLDASIASVSNRGVVTAVDAGSTTIVASTGDLSDTTRVRVFPPVDERFIQVSVGVGHACALAEDGTVYCWGGNEFLEVLGRTGLLESSRPVPVAGGIRFRSVDAGAYHTCGQAIAGGVYCWGAGGLFQLGGHASSPEPIEIVAEVSFASLHVGSYFNCGLTAGGMAYCWGDDGFVTLGRGIRTGGYALDPTPVQTDLRFRLLSPGHTQTCGLAVDGRTYCWGINSGGELGTLATTEQCNTSYFVDWPCSTVPIPIDGAFTFDTLDSKANHTCGLTPEGAASCWGSGRFGELGNGQPFSSWQPQPVVGELRFASLSAGDFYTCGLTMVGEAFCWGVNESGELGNGSTEFDIDRPTFNPTPQRVIGDHSFESLAAGSGNTCGITPEGALFCWGIATNGQLGDGGSAPTQTCHIGPCSSVPVRVARPLQEG